MGRGFGVQRADPLKRHPEVAALDEHFDARPEPQVGISQPFEGDAVHAARNRGRRGERLAAQLCGCVVTTERIEAQRLDQRTDPARRLTEHRRSLAAGEDRGAGLFRIDRGRVGLHRQQQARIEFTGHLQLVLRPLPLTEQREELEQIEAIARMRRRPPHPILQARQRDAEVALFDRFFG